MVDLTDITTLEHPPLVPEIALNVGNAPIGEMWRDILDVEAPPYWLYPWVGGQALARWTLDNSGEFTGRTVLDFGAGTGLNGISAGLAGASTVYFVDEFDLSRQLCASNWELNVLNPHRMEIGDTLPSRFTDIDIVLIGDCFYELELAEYVKSFTDQALRNGCRVLVGDPGREYLPRRRVKRLGKYTVPETWALEKRASMPAYAFELISNG
jgi:predicted nicotinamide N-methyase